MSTEYPPIIVDGGNLIAEDQQIQSVADVTSTTGRVPLRSAQISLYTIYDNEITHIGDYESERVEMDWSIVPAKAVAAGDSEIAIPVGKKRITSIRVPDRAEPLEYGRDFHNLFVLMQPKRERPSGK